MIEFNQVKGLRSVFAKKALDRPENDWKSEGSAAVYCRCRALPMVISTLDVLDKRIEGHITTILGQLEKKPERFGIGEADPDAPVQEWYPPNAYHTYWTLEIFDLIERRHSAEYMRLDLQRRHEGMLLWGRQQLGTQLGLHSSSPLSSVLDSDQLAWSLAIFLRFDSSFKVNLENRDFVRQALKCLFSTQTDGTWRHYKPLFHYKEAGNAYCYVFETFVVLLQCALRETAEAEMVRELLRPYAKNLMDLWRYADSTKMPLEAGSQEVGWCSGHRTNVTDPESWATASVFSYAQALRRLIGIWCREDALDSLRTPLARLAPDKAAERMALRGKTWGVDTQPVSERLWTMFINPVRMHECNDQLEPDSRPIETDHARSAILFGPPGTSKTTLVRSLADVIKWGYVEIHASHFVSAGLPEVQKTADKIFKQLSELDHTVVLFDEIDELVREREMEEDAFGRFLTTSMLPKLAELWEARKILYFVATNHINYFDSAIIRSHRFDALILVSPPSFSSKVEEITRLLSKAYSLPNVRFEVTEPEVQKVLGNFERAEDGSVFPTISSWLHPDRPEQKLRPDLVLAKFALLRWDELQELAYRLAEIMKATSPVTQVVSTDILRAGLLQVADSEWRKNKSYSDYVRDTRSERRDYRMVNAWEVRGEFPEHVQGVELKNGLRWISKAVNSLADVQIIGVELIPSQLGCVEIRRSAAK